jgi:hypothetical protein
MTPLMLDIVGRRMVKPQPPSQPFLADCHIRFRRWLEKQTSGAPPLPRAECPSCIIRRTDHEPMADGYYGILADNGSEILKVQCIGGKLIPLGYD